MDISQFNLEYLRLRSGPEALQLSPEEIKKGNGADAKRWIFHNVPYDNFEKQQVRNLETELIERGVSLPQWWREGDSLRYLYSSKFDHEKTIKSIQECLEWKNNPVSRTVSKDVLNLYESGAVYMYGRDKQFRPVLVFDFGKVDPDKIKSEDFNAAITILLDLAIHYCHLPGKVEGFIILLDTRNVSVTKLPITPLKNWLAIGSACFPGMTIKTYIIGPPFVLRMSWKLIENVMEKDTAAKIEIISVDEMNKIQTLIDPSQLEEKFGGHLSNLTSFWLPKPTYAPTPSMSRKSLHSLQEIHEVSYEGDPTSVKLKTIPLSGYNIPSVPISMQRVASYQSPHKANYQSPAKSGRAQIFEKTSRTSFGAHSPMRVRDQDENLVNEILNSKARPSAPNFQPRQVLIPPSADTSVHFSEAGNTFKPAERVKKAALPIEEYNEGSTFYPEPDTSHINAGGDIMSMIIQEDKYLKKKTEPVQLIPDEYNDFEVKIAERKTTEAKLKQYVDLTHSPQNRARMTHNDYMNGKQSTEKANRYSVDPYKQETQKKSSKPVNSKPEWQYEVSGRVDNSYESYNSASLARRDLNRSLLGELNSSKQVDEWNSRKRRELQMPMPQQGMTDESDDDDGNFCGLCVAGRKKDGTKKKTLKK